MRLLHSKRPQLSIYLVQ